MSSRASPVEAFALPAFDPIRPLRPGFQCNLVERQDLAKAPMNERDFKSMWAQVTLLDILGLTILLDKPIVMGILVKSLSVSFFIQTSGRLSDLNSH